VCWNPSTVAWLLGSLGRQNPAPVTHPKTQRRKKVTFYDAIGERANQPTARADILVQNSHKRGFWMINVTYGGGGGGLRRTTSKVGSGGLGAAHGGIPRGNGSFMALFFPVLLQGTRGRRFRGNARMSTCTDRFAAGDWAAGARGCRVRVIGNVSRRARPTASIEPMSWRSSISIWRTYDAPLVPSAKEPRNRCLV
jgi:hypothetical protein